MKALTSGAPQAVLAAFMLACVSPEPALRAGARTWLHSEHGPLAPGVLRGATSQCPHTAPWFADSVRAFKAGAPHHLVAEASASVDAVLAALDSDAGDDTDARVEKPAAQSHIHAAPQPVPPTSDDEVLWSGQLLKGGAPVCSVHLLMPPPTASPLHTPGGDAREPAGWPTALDVQQRVEHAHVLGVSFAGCAARKRAVRRLVPATPGDVAACADFVTYLKDKARAGAVKLPGSSAAPPRTIYLLPPLAATAAALDVSDPPGVNGLSREQPFLWVVVVAQ